MHGVHAYPQWNSDRDQHLKKKPELHTNAHMVLQAEKHCEIRGNSTSHYSLRPLHFHTSIQGLNSAGAIQCGAPVNILKPAEALV